MSAPKRIKSADLRRDLAEILRYVDQGGTVIVEHYNRPIATITPYEEPKMSKQDITDQVRTFLEAGDRGEDYDLDGIVAEVGDRYGYDIASINTIDPAEWNAILQRHDTST